MLFLNRYCQNWAAIFGAALLIGILIIAASAPILFPGDPFRLAGQPMLPPSKSHWLGTDMLGRDVAAGIAHGATTSISVGIIASFLAIVLGTIVGGIAGYVGGFFDNILMRITEVFQTVPSFIFAIVLVALFSPTIVSVLIAITIVSWPPVARLVRGEVLSLKRREYVEAAVTIGMSNMRIVALHILPNCLSSIIVAGSLMAATAILIESGLSFLGLGDPNVISWGFQIGAGRAVLRSAWWVCTFPGLAILITVLAINLVGEGLNDALNPRLRERSS